MCKIKMRSPEELDALKENLSSHKSQIDHSTRLEVLVDLGESACKGLEIALQQLEDVAVVKYGYVAAPTVPSSPALSPSYESKKNRNFSSPIRSPSSMSDPPTPRLDGLSNAARSLLGGSNAI